MPAQLKVSFSANQKLAASCRGEWPQITHWYWNRLVKFELPVWARSQSRRNESSAGNWLQLNRLSRLSCHMLLLILVFKGPFITLSCPLRQLSRNEPNRTRALQRTASPWGEGKILEEVCDHPPAVTTRRLPVTQCLVASGVFTVIS